MEGDQRRAQINRISEQVIGCAYRVANALGCGFLEKVYENALAHEIRKAGLTVAQQHPIRVQYDNIPVGDYFADLLVEHCVVIEIKAVKALDDVHMAQCLNYLKATGLTLCLLLNFATASLEIKRVVRKF